MNTTQRTSIIDPRILSSWREQITQTTVPRIKQQLVQQEQTLLPRFAAYYDTLQHMPRRMRRSLQRQWKQSLAGVALLLTLGQAPALAAQIDVGIGGCTLVDAVTAANTGTPAGGCSAGSGADIIVLPANSIQTLTSVNNTTYGATGLPVITSEITIQGNGSTITRLAGSPNFRIIALNGGGNLTLQRTTISGGNIDGTIPGSDDGGGIANYGGTVTLTDSTLTGNTAASVGGGVLNFNHFGTQFDTRGTMTLTNSTVSGNFANNNVGGVFNGDTITLTNSTVSGNSAYYIGGMVNFHRMTLTNSTVSGNSANNLGGMFNDGILTLSRTLISGNTGSFYSEVYNSSFGISNANNFNLFGSGGVSGTNFTPGATDIVPSGPVSSVLNTTLANNGGPTQTHALVTGSPAVDTAGGTCLATDQRGIPRPQGPACDIGAFELAVTPLPTTCNGVAITIFGTNGDDVITGTPSRDVIHALAGNDQVSSLAGNDVLCGGEGNDRLFGGVGLDRLEGDSGADQLFGGDQNDVIVGGLDNDQLNGGLGNDIVVGSEGNDALLGNDGNDRLFGEVGDDRLFGGAGDDLLNGGLNTDYCDGQTGGGDSASACETTLNVE